MNIRSPFYRALALALVLSLCGAPQLVAQTTPQDAPQEQAEPQPQQPNVTADPAQGPVEPVPSTAQEGSEESEQELPDAPSADRAPAGEADAQAAPAQGTPAQPLPSTQQPAGTAAAEKTATVGGAGSKPAGTAIAPAKQRQVRSLLIKLGAIAAAGAAIGIVYSLSRSSPSTPPGAPTTNTAARR